MKVRLTDDSHVTNVDKLLAGTKCFIGRKIQRKEGASCCMCGAPVADSDPRCMRLLGKVKCPGFPEHEFAATGEAEEVSDHADHMQAVSEGHLEIVSEE